MSGINFMVTVVKLLLEKNAKIDARIEAQMTPLHVCSSVNLAFGG
jgi:hypothetical protein